MKKIGVLINLLFAISIVGKAQQINLKQMKYIGSVDERYQSYNIEMCEIVGGDFWIPYEKIDSVSKHSGKTGFAALKWKIEPINLYQPKLRNLAAALGPAYVRVSGTWANNIYFQNNDDPILSQAPNGFGYVLTRKQWKGVVDFCKAVDGKIVSSFAISEGMHEADGTYKTDQVKELIDFTKSIGGKIEAAEMFNEPTLSSHGSAPKGYDAAWYAKDFKIFNKFVRSYYPEMMVIGPGSVGEGGILESGTIKFDIPTEELMSKLPSKPFDIYAYHFYGGISKRCGGDQTPESVLSQSWLSRTEKGLAYYEESRNKFNPKAPIWLNETAEAACGGDPLASTYVDTFRYLEQLGRLAKKGVQSVMHNTLARSEYGLLEQDTFTPRPNYWVALLWANLMGSNVYEASTLSAGVDIFAHNTKGTTTGKTILILNINDTYAEVGVPKEAELYLLTADTLLSKNIKLNGKELKLNANDTVPKLESKKVNAGRLSLPPHSIVFLKIK